MRPYYFDIDAARTRRAMTILSFERERRGGPPPRQRSLDEWLHNAMATLRLWHRRAYERNQLAHLDARLLRDIGVTPSEAASECEKPFWRP